MAITVASVVEDTPVCKVFTLTVPEGDAPGVGTNFVYTAQGMTPTRCLPEVKIVTDITPHAIHPTGECTISIYFGLNLNTSFSVMKTSAIVAGAPVSRTFRVMLLCKNFYEV